MAYNSKYTGAEVDALLDKIKDDDVGDIDSSLSTTSEYPVMNKVITTELNKKATKTEVSSLSTTVTENKTATDTALSDLSAKVDEEVEALQSQLDSNGVLIEDLQESKADVSGYYPQLSVGLSDNLPDRGDIVEGAIGFRASAGEGNSIEDGVANVKELLGDSVVWNQQVSRTSKSTYPVGCTVTNGETLTIKGTANGTKDFALYPGSWNPYLLIADHKYAIINNLLKGTLENFRTRIYYSTSSQDLYGSMITTSQESGVHVSPICQLTSGTEYDAEVLFSIHDLTLMFGAGNEPSTVDEFNAFCNQLVGVDLNAYNEGEVLGVHAKGFKSVNDNAWDEEWESGGLDTTTGENIDYNGRIRSKNFIKVLGGQEYYFSSPSQLAVRCYDINKNFLGQSLFPFNGTAVIPSNCAYIRFNVDYPTTYNNDICIRLAHSGYKTDYVAHEESEVSFDLSEYFPYGMHGIGEVRDSATPSKATRRIGVVDLGTLSWNLSATYSSLFFARIADVRPSTSNNLVGNILTSKYVTLVREGIHNYDKSCALDNVYSVFVKDSAYTDEDSFKAAMSGVMLYYELAEPIETEIDPMKNFSYEVWDFGTEEMLSDVPSMPVTTRTIYGFNATDTIRGNKATIENHEERITDLENEVVRVGDYQPDLSVGVADQLAGHEDATPSEIGFRRSGGGAILDGNARIESIKGNSVVWNNSVDNSLSGWGKSKCTLTMNGDVFKMTITADGNSYVYYRNDAFIKSLRVGHKYLRIGSFNKATTGAVYFRIADASGDSDSMLSANGSWNRMYRFFSISSINSSTPYLQILCSGALENEYIEFRDIQFIDLTLMFGAGNEPTTIEEFYARIPSGIDEYAYNEGEVIHMDADAIKSVGVNQWDEEWEEGGLALASGLPIALDGSFRSKNFIPIFPSIDYYITWAAYAGDKYVFFYDREQNFISRAFSSTNVAVHSPTNAAYCKIRIDGGMPFHNDICINLSDTEVNGEYFPYIAREQSLDIIGKYFPQGMKSAGTAHDEIRYNKTTQKWEAVKRIGEVDLGELTGWSYSPTATDAKRFFVNIPSDMKGVASNAVIANIVSNRFNVVNYLDLYANGIDACIALASNGTIQISSLTYADINSFVSHLQNIQARLWYELAEPIVTEIDENINLDYEVWNVGTEQAIAEAPSTPLKADIIYGFNAYGVIKELLARVASLEAANASLASQLASVTSHNEEV